MNVKKFYSTSGWKINKGKTKDAILFEDLRTNSKEYVSNCRLRILRYIPKKGANLLDFASGPIQYKEYLKYSQNFKKRHCVDFSKTAINEAKKKLKNKGKYYHKDFLKMNFKKNYFDCVISLHTIYHINKAKQSTVIRKLINISKSNSPIIIVYSNPNTLINKFKNLLRKKKKTKKNKIYFYCHNLKWWSQFKNIANINFFPWRSFSTQHQKMLFPDNIIGKYLMKILFKLEDIFPNFFVKNFQYHTIIIKKK